MTRRRTSNLRGMADEVIKRSGASSRDEYLSDRPPTQRQRASPAGKGDEHRPVLVSAQEYERRQQLLWFSCPACGKEQMHRTDLHCIRCGSEVPPAEKEKCDES